MKQSTRTRNQESTRKKPATRNANVSSDFPRTYWLTPTKPRFPPKHAVTISSNPCQNHPRHVPGKTPALFSHSPGWHHSTSWPHSRPPRSVARPPPTSCHPMPRTDSFSPNVSKIRATRYYLTG